MVHLLFLLKALKALLKGTIAGAGASNHRSPASLLRRPAVFDGVHSSPEANRDRTWPGHPRAWRLRGFLAAELEVCGST